MSFPNYAGRNDVDEILETELAYANIEHTRLPEVLRARGGEVKTVVVGSLLGWTFERAWRYWVCRGPGIPCKEAMQLHKEYGTSVRVNGHCGCPSPYEWFKGLAVGHYHVDTNDGLLALSACIRKVAADAAREFAVPTWTPLTEPEIAGEEAQLIPLEQFWECIIQGWFTNDDGVGVFATETHKSNITVEQKNQPNMPQNATHVLWFAK